MHVIIIKSNYSIDQILPLLTTNLTKLYSGNQANVNEKAVAKIYNDGLRDDVAPPLYSGNNIRHKIFFCKSKKKKKIIMAAPDRHNLVAEP